MIRSVIGMHNGREQCIFIGLTPADVEHLAKGNGMRYSIQDMTVAGMPGEHPISLAFVWGENHEAIIAEVTKALEEFGKEVDVVHEQRRHGAPSTG